MKINPLPPTRQHYKIHLKKFIFTKLEFKMLGTMAMRQPENWLYEIWQKGYDSPCYVMVPNAKVRIILKNIENTPYIQIIYTL